ncbi:uncharacterized protein LOC113961500 isoform X2 [Neopelma chrysocephalum]|uniref:uncharacterized protein LOC113961500 isoform X2 n=1 Tax=Neopelma chrysocephalum TaxID=114329 RepID=UPI000FCD12C7|nr:uncharacterized protein LOC113961500 isoform X2 [Neopelma chrysocephalum]
MSEHKWLTSRRLQEAHLYISPEFNWDSAPLTPSDPTLLVSAEGDSDLHSTTKLLHFTDHKPQKIIVWKEHTGSTHPVHLTQSTAHFGILSILKESHTSTARADLAKKNSDQLSIENTFCRRTLLPNANKKEVWETASSLHKD